MFCLIPNPIFFAFAMQVSDSSVEETSAKNLLAADMTATVDGVLANVAPIFEERYE